MARHSDSESRRKHSRSSSRRDRNSRSRSRERSRRSRSWSRSRDEERKKDRRHSRSRSRSRERRDRRRRSRSSERRRSRRSRSRDRGRSKDRERESRGNRLQHRSSDRDRSRESSYDSRRSSKIKSKRERRRSRSASSSASSGGSSIERHYRDKRSQTKETSGGVSLKTSADRKARVKEFLKAVEARDEEKWRKDVQESGATIVPDAEAVLRIESNEFVQESFTSSSNKKAQELSKQDTSEQGHEHAIFGTGRNVVTPSSKQSKAVAPSALSSLTQPGYESSVASCLHEDEETKTIRWIAKLKRMSQQLLAPS